MRSSLARALVLLPVLVSGCVVPERTPRVADPAADGAVLFIPGEPTESATVFATVVAIDYAGRVSVESDRGPLDVWIVDPRQYRVGERLRIDVSVRPVRLERAAPGVPRPAPQPELNEPGDHAVVIGQVTSVDSRGTITVDSPRGPLRVWVRSEPPTAHQAGNWVEVRTKVVPAP
jgi:hypothetical protein